jgi:hypothetical protein
MGFFNVEGVVMKKVDNFMKSVDAKVENVEHHIPTKVFAFIKKYFVYFSSLLLATIACIFVYQVLKERPYYLTTVIRSDFEQIEKNLTAIDTECNILSIVSTRAQIDFLNIEKFAGSMVGCLNLAYPAKWKGAYMQRNPTLQGIFYELAKTADGFYIVPGHGVKLPNGLIVGKHFEINTSFPIVQMLQPGGKLNYKGEPLARKVKFIIGNWDSPMTDSAGTFDRVSKALKEFSDALPFVQNETTRDVHKF